MTPDTRWSRRDVLRSLAAVAAVPAMTRAAGTRRTVGIVGGGMAGISLAWLLDGSHDVIVFEARDAIGGNVRTIDVEIDGYQVPVDVGAQYFHPGPYPLYTALLVHLGLYPPDAAPGGAHAVPASITVAADSEAWPRFVSPVFWERAWPLFDPANQDGLAAFGTAFAAAKVREQLQQGWSLTLGDWLQTLGLSTYQREQILLPWAASLFSGSIEQARGLSARAAMIFAARALPANPLDPLLYFVLEAGMGDVLDRLLAQCSAVQVLTGAAVNRVDREAAGGFTVHCADGREVAVDDLVLAASGPATWYLLHTVPGTEAQRAAVAGIQFHHARLALHTDPIYAPPHPATWSFLNCRAHGDACEASMWMDRVLAGVPRATAAKLWKSWITQREQLPAQIVHEADFVHMLPTPSTLAAQTAVHLLQGREGLWIAGGYLFPYDSQETALRSALGIAVGLGASTLRGALLAAADTATIHL